MSGRLRQLRARDVDVGGGGGSSSSSSMMSRREDVVGM
jgi:hypothetical protein